MLFGRGDIHASVGKPQVNNNMAKSGQHKRKIKRAAALKRAATRSKRKSASKSARRAEKGGAGNASHVLGAVFQAMREGVALHEIVWGPDGKPANYRIIDTNPGYESNTKLRKGNVIGRLGTEVYGTTEPPYMDIFSRVALSGGQYSFETHFEPMDLDFKITAISPSHGMFVTIFEDITERKRMAEALSSSEQKFMAIHEHAPFGVVLLSMPAPRITEVNVAWQQMFGFSRDEVIGKTADELGIIPDSDARLRLHAAVRTQGAVRDYEMEYVTRSGERRIGSFSFSKVMIGGLRIISALSSTSPSASAAKPPWRRRYRPSRGIV